MIKPLKTCLVLASCTILASGCAFMKLKKEVAEIESTVGLSGEITLPTPDHKPVVVMLYEEQNNKKGFVDYNILKNDNLFLFFVKTGKYYVIAFEDQNNNLKHDEGEYFGIYGRPDPIQILKIKGVDRADIRLDKTSGFPIEFPDELPMGSSVSNTRVATGKITSLDNEAFSERNAKMGYWEPLSFLKAVGFGIYFLEPYTPRKIPILFVHGASGTPHNWTYFADKIDRSQFQPWFFHYPSGIQLGKVSNALNKLVKRLHNKYQFDRLFVTAHSMGGLVSRGFIIRNVFNDDNDYIKLFVSISSPFGGLEVAEKGVKRAPTAIPSWYDMVPNSPYIKSIFNKQLHEKMGCYLFFSHKGNASLFMDNNDGSVTLRSQLDPRAQDDAIRIFGFDEGHVSILSSPMVFNKYKQILMKY